MIAILASIRQFLSPPVPQEVRDDFVTLQFTRMQSQIPLLYITLILSVIAAALAVSREVTPFVRVGLPALVVAACVGRFFIWARRRSTHASVEQAIRIIRGATVISSSIAALCSIWSVYSWMYSPPGSRVYIAFFMAMGSLSTAYCLSTIRSATLLNLAIGLIPLSALQLVLGDQMDRSVGGSLLVATMFLIRMIHQQHVHLVDLLMLQRMTSEQAHTDALTGLLNRRALYDILQSDLAEGEVSVLLLDLDGFKPVNDRHGHAAGDELLRQVSDRLRFASGPECRVARLGGDEFAVIVPRASCLETAILSDQLLAALVRPFSLAAAEVRISASLGIVTSPAGGQGVDQLMESADRMLYAAKELHYHAQTPSAQRLPGVDDMVGPAARGEQNDIDAQRIAGPLKARRAR